MTRNLALVTAAAVLAAGSAMAQSSGDWTGFYGGAQVGYIDLNTDIDNVNGDGIIGGVILGYDYDLGDWVVGGGFDYDFADTEVGDDVATLEDVWRIKARVGYNPIDEGLLYGTIGYADASTDNLGSDNGWFIGAGYEQVVVPNVSVGGELVYHRFDNFNSTGADIDATTFQLRASYRF